MMIAELIFVGTELLLGQVLNTNARYLSEQMAKLGIDVYYHTTVGDNRLRLLETYERAVGRADIIITTGGLGPTSDDLTKETLAEFLNLPLQVDAGELARLKRYFTQRGIEWIESNTKQAAFFPGSAVLRNDYGTAPGVAVNNNGKTFILLPGPPREMEHMFSKYAVSWLKENVIKPGTPALYSRLLRFVGISESKLEKVLSDLIARQTVPTLAPLVSLGEIQLRITARARDELEFQEIIEPVLKEIKNRAGEYLVAEDGGTLLEAIAGRLKQLKLTISAAESCTGGLLSASLTSLPGSSQYFLGSVVAYSNDVKINLLGVPAVLIEKYGAVSVEAAEAMAGTVRKMTGSSIGLGITGVAGPGGGSEEKPVGLVFIGLDAGDKKLSVSNHFTGDREFIRQRSVKAAQYLIYKYLSGIR
ncbi:MAG: competence/damage-inducible protein A [Peptococcaceae bacterium]|jgi:nicotinamide-nucleotide amidase|nr:competence/damage-inducible protein A [Peptococcaceae bacterium]MDH7524112.1 competence/damage-inducible protein A [Peptococcaceae bacterium]